MYLGERRQGCPDEGCWGRGVLPMFGNFFFAWWFMDSFDKFQGYPSKFSKILQNVEKLQNLKKKLLKTDENFEEILITPKKLSKTLKNFKKVLKNLWKISKNASIFFKKVSRNFTKIFNPRPPPPTPNFLDLGTPLNEEVV